MLLSFLMFLLRVSIWKFATQPMLQLLLKMHRDDHSVMFLELTLQGMIMEQFYIVHVYNFFRLAWSG